MSSTPHYLFPPTVNGINYNGQPVDRLYVNGSLAYDAEWLVYSMTADAEGKLAFQHYYSQPHKFYFEVKGLGYSSNHNVPIHWKFPPASRNSGWQLWWYGGYVPNREYMIRVKVVSTNNVDGVFHLGDPGHGVAERKLTAIHSWGTHPINTLYRLFKDATNDVNYIPDHLPRGCVSLYDTFRSYTGTMHSNISLWDVSKVEMMYGTFSFCQMKGINVENWFPDSLVNGNYMFIWSSINQDLGGWRPKNAISLYQTMHGCSKNTKSNLSNWCCEKVPASQLSLFGKLSPFWENSSNWPKFGVPC